MFNLMHPTARRATLPKAPHRASAPPLRPHRSTTTQNQPRDPKRHPPQPHRAGAKVAAPRTPRERRRGATQAAGLLVDAAIGQG